MSPKFVGLRHAALLVEDLKTSMAFYRDILGMELEWKPDSENAYLTSGSDNLALHQLPAGREPGDVQVLDHIGFAVARPEDVDAWAERLGQKGIEIAKPPKTHRDGARSFYFLDPDRILIQIIHHPPMLG
jgi:catechol 2,3-dioxygenase-like lactoylglutathione lyase family enzyme